MDRPGVPWSIKAGWKSPGGLRIALEVKIQQVVWTRICDFLNAGSGQWLSTH